MGHKKIPYLVFALAIYPIWGGAQVAERHLQQAESMNNMFVQVYDNPAMRYDRFPSSLNRVELACENRWSTISPQLEKGKDAMLWGTHATAFLRKTQYSLWGRATYQSHRIKDIRYCETSDFDMLYPYVMADTVTASTTRLEVYDFLGGFAYNMGKWKIGAQGNYKAMLNSRTIDPRTKNLTSDLHMAVGASFQLLPHYEVGGGISIQFYKQTNEVKFYNEVSHPVIYHLTGLGSDYYRFRGEYTQNYYKGTGCGLDMGLKPKSERGLYVANSYHLMSTEKIISDLNELPLVRLDVHYQAFEAGYIGEHAVRKWGVRLYEGFENRRGRENIFGAAVDNVYPKISGSTPYDRKQWAVGLMGSCHWRLPSVLYKVAVSSRYEHSEESYATPYRCLKGSDVSAFLQLAGAWRQRRWLFQVDAETKYIWSISSKLILPPALHGQMLPPVHHRVSFLGSDRYTVDNTVEASYDTGREFSVFAKMGWQYAHYMAHDYAYELRFAMGMEF